MMQTPENDCAGFLPSSDGEVSANFRYGDVDHIITPTPHPPSTALRLEEMGIELTIADSVHHNSI